MMKQVSLMTAGNRKYEKAEREIFLWKHERERKLGSAFFFSWQGFIRLQALFEIAIKVFTKCSFLLHLVLQRIKGFVTFGCHDFRSSCESLVGIFEGTRVKINKS